MSDYISREAAIDSFPLQGTLDARYVREILAGLPSVQPEIIRCKDCKNWAVQVKDVKGDGLGACIFHKANFVTGEGYCYWAERREDG